MVLFKLPLRLNLELFVFFIAELNLASMFVANFDKFYDLVLSF